MKKLILTTILVIGSLSAYAGGVCYYPYRSCSSFSFSIGVPLYSSYSYYRPTFYAPAAYAYPSYSYAYPGYGAYSSGYAASYPGYSYRPNYAVGGTLLGGLIGGIIGNNVHHQTWEGAAIGAGAGLLLGGLAQHSARTRERAAYDAPPVSYAQPNYIADAPAVNPAPTAPAAPQVQNPVSYRPASAMNGANSLFGR